MTFIDLFAGAGGLSLGFEMAGGQSLLTLEKDEWAFETYKINRPQNKGMLLNGDIKSYNLDRVSKDIVYNPDVIIGGPPCQGFSVATGKKDLYDSRNELFNEFLNWVDYFKPKFFVIENVLGLNTKKDSQGDPYKELIMNKFEKIGYSVNFWTLNAMNYGVPQQRVRVFFVGTILTNEIILPPDFTYSNNPELGLKECITVNEAIGDLPFLSAGGGEEIAEYDTNPLNDFQKWARLNSKNVLNHVAMKHSPRLVNRYKLIQHGKSIVELPDEYKVRKRGDTSSISEIQFGLNYRLLNPDRSSYTIPASFYSSFVHPFQPRNITAREAARLQSFPDHYKFYGKRTLVSNSMLKKRGLPVNLSQYNQIGNAVPPLLAKAIAEKLKHYI
jgi:DNA (cytosine-5)-methyltransferase 1